MGLSGGWNIFFLKGVGGGEGGQEGIIYHTHILKGCFEKDMFEKHK